MSRAVPRRAPQELVGRDFARVRLAASRPRRALPALVVGALAAGLALAALRIDILRLRYSLHEALQEQQTLVEQRNEALARVHSLRDPKRLASLARQRGFARPERVIELPSARRARAARP
jgi:hypothetical protein